MKSLFKYLLPILVLAGGGGVFFTLLKSRPEATSTPLEERPELVEVMRAELRPNRVVVNARGTVVPARSVVLSPQVAGRVVELHPGLVPGGRIAEGDELLKIETRDYRLAVAQAESQVVQAELQLAVERGRKRVAEREWKLIEHDEEIQQDADKSLALREPHLAAAEAGVEAAEASLALARLNLKRTRLTAPFDAVVQAKQVEIGQLVMAQSPAVTLVASDRYRVHVSTPLDRVAYIDIPGVAGATEGSAAQVVQRSGSRTTERRGRVVQLLSEVDPLGRMARLAVDFDAPLDGEERVPIVLGSFVEVAIDGREIGEVFQVPRSALLEGDRVWLAGPDDRLAEAQLEVIWRQEDAVLATAGLKSGQRIITNRLSGPVVGMKLRVEGRLPSASAAPAQAKAAP